MLQASKRKCVSSKSWRHATPEENLLYKVLGLEMWGVFLLWESVQGQPVIFFCAYIKSLQSSLYEDGSSAQRAMNYAQKPWISKLFLKNCIKDEPLILAFIQFFLYVPISYWSIYLVGEWISTRRVLFVSFTLWWVQSLVLFTVRASCLFQIFSWVELRCHQDPAYLSNHAQLPTSASSWVIQTCSSKC